jgi:adenylate kinase family enzyme
VVRDRLRIYHQFAGPVAEFYRRRGQLEVVDGDQAIARVAAAMDDILAVRVVA